MNKWIKKGCIAGLALCCMPLLTACSAKETLSILWDFESENEEEVVVDHTKEVHTIDDTVEKPAILNDISAPMTVELNAQAEGIFVDCAVNDGGTLTYQWYRNNVDSNGGGTLIEGAVESTFIPPTDKAGVSYYYVVITNSIGDRIQLAASGTKCVTVVEPVVEDVPEEVVQPDPAVPAEQAVPETPQAPEEGAVQPEQAPADPAAPVQ